LFSLTRHQRAVLKSSETFAGAATATLLAETRALLITLLLGNMTINVLYFVISTKLLLHVRDEHLMGSVALGALTVAPLLVVIIFGEVLPKLVAARTPVAYSKLTALPLLAVHRAITPIRLVASGIIITPLARLIAPSTRPDALSQTELASLLELSQRQGVIDPQEQRMLGQVLGLGRVKVDGLMTPRVDIEAFDLDAEPGTLIELFKRTNLRQAPAYREDLDHIEGFITARRVLLDPPKNRKDIDALIEPVTYVPQQQRADQLLAELRKNGQTIAVIVDEYGGTAGLITLEDVAEHLVGDIAGAYDSDGEPAVEELAPGCWRVSAELSTRNWVDAFSQNTPPDILETLSAVNTLGGLVMARLGRSAKVGDQTTIGNLVLTVDAMDGNRIDQVSIRLTDSHTPDGKGVSRE